jgi:tetratricopeptide (TPR) repeat protein
MRFGSALLCIVLSPCLLAQQTAKSNNDPPKSSAAPVQSCGIGTIDEYLAAKKKAKRVHDKNPLPDDVCVFGWCRSNPNAPDPTNLPTSHPSDDTTGSAKQSSNESSSKPVIGPTCDVYSAVHDVEVGDFNYEDKNFRGALIRYKSALDNKPNDPGILLRLGKTFEKLGDLESARGKYQASIAAAPEGPTAKESKSALSHLAPKSAK